MKKFPFITSVLFLGFLMSCKFNDVKLLHATNSLIFTQGRVSEIEKLSVDFAYPGVSFEIKVKAKSVSAVLMDVGGSAHNHFNVLVDGAVVKTIEVSNKKESYLLVDDLDDATFHTIQLFKRTESFVGVTRFFGFELTGFVATAKVDVPNKKLLIIGDSFSCGYGNDVEFTADQNPETGFHAKNENNYKAYGAIAARELNYQYQCIAYSGRGMYRNFNLSKTNTLPDIFPLIFPDKAESKQWDMKNYIPDVIVIKLGTNDFFGESRSPIQVVDSAAYVTAYLNFVTYLKELFPKAQVVCVVGGMMSDSWPAGRNNLTTMRNYVVTVIEKANTEAKSEKCHYLEFPQHQNVYGEDWHPTASWHLNYAELLIDKVKSL